MPTYIVLIKSTQKGFANPKTLANDVERANVAVAGFGGKLLDSPWGYMMRLLKLISPTMNPLQLSR